MFNDSYILPIHHHPHHPRVPGAPVQDEGSTGSSTGSNGWEKTWENMGKWWFFMVPWGIFIMTFYGIDPFWKNSQFANWNKIPTVKVRFGSTVGRSGELFTREL